MRLFFCQIGEEVGRLCVRVKLNYFWRLLMTALAFSSFSIGGLCLSVFVFPFLYVLPTRHGLRRRVARRCIQLTFKLFVKMMCVSGIMSLDVHRAERLRNARGMLVLANHPTLIDVVVMISYMPFANCVVKSKLWDNFFLGGVVRAAGYIRNDDKSEALIEDSSKSLCLGESLIIFPEGTRSVAGKPFKFLRGAAHIALASEAQILPVILTCTPPTLSKAERWYQIPSRRFHITLDVEDPLLLNDLVDCSLASSVASRRLTETLQHYFSQKLSHRTSSI